MKVQGVLVSILLALSIIGACKKSDDTADVKFDKETAHKLAQLEIAEVDMASICDRRTLVVYVGNAEKVGLVDEQTLRDSSFKKKYLEQAAANDKAFVSVIQKGWKDLNAAMTRSKCWSREKPGIVTLLKIFDGPGANDSDVEIVNYTKADHSATTGKHYVAKLKKDVKPEASVYDVELEEQPSVLKPFELNMPRSFNSIVLNAFGKNADGYQQIYYIFKAHGGVYTAAPEKISLFKRVAPDLTKPIFLFDNYGIDGKPIRSNIFSPFWYRERACQIYKTSKDPKATEYSKQECGVAKGGSSGTDGGSSGTDGGSSGTDGGSSGTDGGSSGTDGGSSGTDGGSSGTDGGSSGTDGGSSGTDGGSSGTDGGSSGAGKGSVFVGKMPRMAENAPDEEKPDGILLVGEAATYNDVTADMKGVVKLQLLTGTELSGFNTVLLDSCYGSPKMMDAVKRFWAPIDRYITGGLDKLGIKSGSTHLVVMANQAPIYYDLIGYDKLDGHLFLGLPILLYKGLQNKNAAYEKQLQSIREHFQAGLEVSNNEAQRNNVVGAYSQDELKKLIVSFKELNP